MTLGLSRASRSRLASALPYDSSAWSGWPVALWRLPMLLLLSARSLWNWVTLGFSREPLLHRQRLAVRFQCLVRMARGALEASDVVVA